MKQSDDENPGPRPPAFIIVYTGRYPPRLSHHTKRFLAKSRRYLVAIPDNGRGDVPNLVIGGDKP
jgi:hypothetical protein